MKKLRNAVLLLAAAMCFSSCSAAKTEENEAEAIVYDKTEVKEAFNAEIDEYYSSLEDYRKKDAEFAYFDIDGNGTDELLLRTWNGGCDVYAYSETGVSKCGEVYDSLYSSPSGSLVSIENFGGGSEGCREYSINEGKLVSKVLFSIDSQGNEKLPEFGRDEEIKDYRTLKDEYSGNPVGFLPVSENISENISENEESTDEASTE